MANSVKELPDPLIRFKLVGELKSIEGDTAIIGTTLMSMATGRVFNDEYPIEVDALIAEKLQPLIGTTVGIIGYVERSASNAVSWLKALDCKAMPNATQANKVQFTGTVYGADLFSRTEINYRRFFNINDLISLRIEDEQVFNHHHSLILRLVADGGITGLRVDHVDGLYDPTRYLQRLREKCKDVYLVVEKILDLDEDLPPYWPVQGTTGYYFVNYVNGIFCRRENEQLFSKLCATFTGQKRAYEEVATEKKLLIMGKYMAGDIDNVAHLLKASSRRDRFGSDITLYGLKRVFVIAGSRGKTGAAMMTAMSCMRAGAGLVTLAIPKSLNAIMEMKLTEVMTEPLPETPKQTLSLRAFSTIVRLCENKKAVIIGPGLGTFKETQSLVLKLIRTLEIPIILDADGLTALATQPKTLPLKNRSLILTPHPGEMARLIRSTVKEVLEDRIGVSKNFSQTQHVHLILKGHPTLITTPKGEVFINPTGNPGMASGGTGDVLTGMIGGLVCQGFDILSSLQIAVYLHGMAGDEGVEEMGEKSLIATDIIEKIPALLKGRI